MKKVFIDGKEGTTGLNIYERIKDRDDITLITLKEEERKDITARKKAINESDITILCLPDSAAIESVSLCENQNTVIIDASTAHRTKEGWLYGFAEIDKDFAKKVKTAKRIANPGCHASGFIALVKPLIDNGIIDSNASLCTFSITGYSGGGKKMIASYEENKDENLSFPRQYGLNQSHKHLKEMAYVCGLKNLPAFSPVVAPFYSGMEVSVWLFNKDLKEGKGVQDIINAYKSLYNNGIVEYDSSSEDGFLSSGILSGKDSMKVGVYGNEERILLTARYDNLGKGACGSAIECLNYVLGVDEKKGLKL